MKTKSILAILFAMSIILTSCEKNENYVAPSANVTTVEKSVNSFNELDIEDPFKVYITFSETEENVRIEANANLQGYIKVTQQDEKLRIKLDDRLNINEGESTLNVIITMRKLNKLEAAGATMIVFQNELISDEFETDLTGACELSGKINVNQLDALLDGASNLMLSGSTNIFNIEATGASGVEGYALEATNLEADLNGACQLNLTVHENMDVRATGASKVYYKGDAHVNNANLSGGSEIIKVN